MILAASLAFLGVHLGVDLYLAAIFAIGIILFQNIAVIRRFLLTKWFTAKEKLEKNDFFKGNHSKVPNNLSMINRESLYGTKNCCSTKEY